MRGIPGFERRRYDRVTTSGSVVLHAPHHVRAVRGRVENLSARGALIRVMADAELPAAPVLLRIDLHLDAAPSGWVHCHGEVRRRDPERVAVRFTGGIGTLEDVVQDAQVAAIETERSPPIILVDPLHPRRARLAGALRDSGCDVVEASSPLEAISSLQATTRHAWLILVGDTLPGHDAELLRAYARDAHPGVQQATVDELADLGEQVARLIATRH